MEYIYRIFKGGKKQVIENIKKEQVRNDTYILNKIMRYLKLNIHKVVNDNDLSFIYEYIKENRKKRGN